MYLIGQVKPENDNSKPREDYSGRKTTYQKGSGFRVQGSRYKNEGVEQS
jgi:hypothetical protein